MRCFREGDLKPSGRRLKFIMTSIELNIDDYHKNYDFEHKSVLQKALATETNFQGLTKTTRE